MSKTYYQALKSQISKKLNRMTKNCLLKQENSIKYDKNVK